ncbi:D-3-phosphoglycerate dehydrogenase [Vibrio maritimus]|uniref:D-3-phosphoglycerate dehydrogenase n=1 Tax=Vibrio maritimus TaxID=990268 RepID=A0A090TFQ8_9VIBR|nr:D-3-phosphoglycerate dehydrogenase [Vibrio maritimus]
MTVTPHIAAISFPEQVVDIFAENFLRWRDGFQLQNVIDFERGY